MNHTRRAPLIALALAAGTGAALLVAPPAAADETLHLTTIASGNTDLDLAPGEPGPGDTQVFHDEVQRNGRHVGTNEGLCVLTSVSDTNLAAVCTGTVLFANGSSLTLQGGFQENPQQGPTDLHWAVTGGTGHYRGASGEATGTFRDEQSPDGFDVVDIEVRLR